MSQKPPDKMSLVFLKRTRQVMAGATRTAVPTIAVPTGSETDDEKKKNAADELKVLVGPDLVVRDLPIKSFTVGPSPGFAITSVSTVPDFIKSGVLVVPSELEIVTTDFKQNIFRDSRLYFIDSDAKPVLSSDPASLTFKATLTDLRITLTAAVAADTTVSILIYVKSSLDPPVPVDCKIEEDQPNPRECVISVRLTTGVTYQFLTLVQGYVPAVFEQTV
jgi:hypothetical protein